MGAQPLSIVVPVYNEAENFPLLWAEMVKKIRSDFRVYVAYDFEGDTTVPVVRELMKTEGHRLQLVLNTEGRGVVGAIRSGFAQVSSGPVLVTMADLSDDLAMVDAMVEKHRQGFHVVAGSRYMRGGRMVGGPLVKRWLSRLAGLSLHYLRGIPTHDATNSFKLYDAAMLHAMKLESTGGFELSLEITVKAFLGGYRIGEVPSSWVDRVHGKSRFRLVQWLPRYLHWYLKALFTPVRG